MCVVYEMETVIILVEIFGYVITFFLQYIENTCSFLLLSVEYTYNLYYFNIVIFLAGLLVCTGIVTDSDVGNITADHVQIPSNCVLFTF